MTSTLLVTVDGTQIVDTQDEHAGDGDTTLDLTYSSVNYKDALALNGNKGVVRIWPMVPGIDAVGTVVESPTLEAGTLVTVNGSGIGETRHGAYTPRMRIDASLITKVPSRFDDFSAAAIGTAGYTAALSVLGLGDFDGDVVVTGATGGVGSIAVQLLSSLGKNVIAVTGRVDEHGDYLRSLGAAEVMDRAELSEPGKPLQKGRFAAAVDTVGGVPLANVLAQVQMGGVVTACGNAAGADLPTTVLPFILRGVALKGINSVTATPELRDEAWQLLANHLDLDSLASMTTTVDLAGTIEVGKSLLAGTHHGRTVVKVS
ncbi:acryloyl-CoA reductase [Corynebacterium lubricantis]|uniref:acrylyl-CoA reductase family protein n=1 Tax=Corynebacterium lubricantis TaxID=541095 RepID=UPI000374BEF8|nr:acryloyl-CoA reductase [Corynebacterium lubricantis]